MTTRRSALRGAVKLGSVIALSTYAAPAFAHDAPRVETEVAHRKDGSLQVTHVLQLSAAQRLLHKAGVIDSNDISGLRARAQTALYSSERFDLFADGKPIELEILGAEVGGGHLYVYQTGQLTSLPENWSARHAILRDLSPRFETVINLPTTDGIRTITFSGHDMDNVKALN